MTLKAIPYIFHKKLLFSNSLRNSLEISEEFPKEIIDLVVISVHEI